MARKSRKMQITALHAEVPKAETVAATVVYRTGIYARKSIDEEKKGNGNESILTQISMLERYVETHAEFQLLESYVDERAIIRASVENLVKSRVSALAPFSVYRLGQAIINLKVKK